MIITLHLSLLKIISNMENVNTNINELLGVPLPSTKAKYTHIMGIYVINSAIFVYTTDI